MPTDSSFLKKIKQHKLHSLAKAYPQADSTTQSHLQAKQITPNHYFNNHKNKQIHEHKTNTRKRPLLNLLVVEFTMVKFTGHP